MGGIFRIAAVTLLVLLAGVPAGAQSYPNRPIRLVVGNPPGGSTDIIARLIAQSLSARLGQPIVIDNRPGAATNIAGDIVAKAAPDGYTLMQGADNLFITNPHLYSKMSFDPLKDFVTIASLVSNQMVLAVNPSLPAGNLKEFVELARRMSPPMFYGSIGLGSQHHLAMEMLKQHAGIELTHVPYRGGGPAAIALLAGEVPIMFGGGSIVPTIQAGKAHGLAVTGRERHPLMPEVPAIAETYPGYEVLNWHGLFAPLGTPQPIIDRLRSELAVVLAQPELRERLAHAGAGEPYIATPEQFAARIRSDHDKYGRLIRAIGLKVE
jgi:tripartite-type tricarboxylate transporter receptor subunit TctC